MFSFKNLQLPRRGGLERSFVFPRVLPRLRHNVLPIALAFILGCLPFATLQAQDASRSLANTPAATAPAWLSNAVVYEIFPRAFSTAGNLQSITDRLDTLHHLGVNVLWLMPIFPIGKEHRLGRLGSPYSISDYYTIDPALGTKADLLQLVHAAHQRHMRVILDMVADHTAWDNPMMEHPNFYQHNASGKIISPHGWSDVAALNYGDPALRQYMDDMFLYWLKNFDLDGFRCDAAGMVPTSFWNQLRPQLKRVNPNALLLAEASKPELMQHAFDLDYAWPLLATLDNVIDNGAPATAIQSTLKAQGALFPHGTQHLLISDDHDEPRATVRYGMHGSLAASALVFSLPGVPLLYNGMESADATQSGGPELFDKYDVDWSASSSFPYVPSFYQDLIALRESSSALQHGQMLWLHNSAEQHVVTFLRRSPSEVDLVAVNLSNTPFRGTVEVASGAWREVTLPQSVSAFKSKTHSPSTTTPLPSALPVLSLDAFQARIFRLITPTHP